MSCNANFPIVSSATLQFRPLFECGRWWTSIQLGRAAYWFLSFALWILAASGPQRLVFPITNILVLSDWQFLSCKSHVWPSDRAWLYISAPSMNSNQSSSNCWYLGSRGDVWSFFAGFKVCYVWLLCIKWPNPGFWGRFWLSASGFMRTY